jgi:hypothetical protein
MATTTIKIDKETKQRLEKLREFKKESYDELLRKILGILNVVKVEPDRARTILDRIDETRALIQARELEEKIKKEKILKKKK